MPQTPPTLTPDEWRWLTRDYGSLHAALQCVRRYRLPALYVHDATGARCAITVAQLDGYLARAVVAVR